MKEKTAILLNELRYFLEDGEIYRLLGYRRGRVTSREEVKSAVKSMKEVSEGLIRARGAYIILSPEGIKERGPFRLAEKVGLGLCTIGSTLEERVRALFNEGRYLEGLALDTIGSVAVESAADQLNFHICDRGESGGLTGDRRFSPGYGSWSLEHQSLFFELLPHKDLGMTLTPSFMMVPRKSISFAVNLMKGGEIRSSSRCSRCGMRDCPFREDDERGDV
ncbi:MAG: hypothetical protein ACE5OP_05200 [Candidatus Glassbacteria bacterium]